MEPKSQRPKARPEPPLQVEGGEIDEAAPEPAPQPSGGMIGEGGGPPAEDGRDGGMIGQG